MYAYVELVTSYRRHRAGDGDAGVAQQEYQRAAGSPSAPYTGSLSPRSLRTSTTHLSMYVDSRRPSRGLDMRISGLLARRAANGQARALGITCGWLGVAADNRREGCGWGENLSAMTS